MPTTWQRLRDIASAFTALLAATPDGTEIDFPPGDYHVHFTLEVRGRHDITLSGPTAGRPARLLQFGDGHDAPSPMVREVIDFQGDTRTAARHLTIVGANPAAEHIDTRHNPYEGNTGITTSLGTDTTVSDCTISRTYGDGIYLGQSARNLVEHSTVSHTGRHGIGVVEGSDATVVDNTVTDVAETGIDVEPNLTVRRVLVAGNELHGANGFLNVNGQQVSDVRITGNRTDGGLVALALATNGTPPGYRRFTRIEIDHNVGGSGRTAPWPGEIVTANIDFLTVVDNRSANRAPVLSSSGSCPARLSGNTSTRGRAFALSLVPEDGTGNAAAVTPAATLASDRLDPTPAVDRAYANLLRRPPTGASLQAWTTQLCRGGYTTPDMLRLLLPRLDHGLRAEVASATLAPIVLSRSATPALLARTATDELAVIAAILASPGAATSSAAGGGTGLERLQRAIGAGGHATALDPSPATPTAATEQAARVATAVWAAPPTRALGAVRDVNLATLATRGRFASGAELARWVPALTSGSVGLPDLLAVLVATPTEPTAPSPCDTGGTDPRLVALFGPPQPLGALRPAC